MLSTSVVYADTIYGRSCEIRVFPFNPQGQLKEYDAAEDFLTPPVIDEGNTNACSQHLDFTHANGYGPTGPYHPQNPIPLEESTISENATEITVPTAYHEHAFFNDYTIAQNDRYYYKAALNKFLIVAYVDDNQDGIDNIKTDHIVCDMPFPPDVSAETKARIKPIIESCNTNGNPLPILGGTNILREDTRSDSGKKIVKVTWTFGINDDEDSPAVFAENVPNDGGNFTVYDVTDGNPASLQVDLTNEYNRTLGFNGAGFGLNLQSANNIQEDAWSATTVSYAYIQNYRIPKATYSEETAGLGYDENHNGWQLIPNPDPSKNPESNIRMPVGSLTSIWRQPTPDIPETPTSKLTLIKQVLDENNAVVNDNPDLIQSFNLYAEKTDPAQAEAMNAAPRGRPVSNPQNQPARQRRAPVQPKRLSLGGSIFELAHDLVGIPLEMQMAFGDRVNYKSGETHDVEADSTYTIGEEQKEGYTLQKIECKNSARADDTYGRLGANHQTLIPAGIDVTCRLTNKSTDSGEETCPDGSPIPENGVCENPPLECPDGQVLNITSGLCVPIICEENEHLVGNECVPDNPEGPVCDPGYFSNGVECVPNIPIEPICPPGFVQGPLGCVQFNPPSGGVPAGSFDKTVSTLNDGPLSVIQQGDSAKYKLTFTATQRNVDSVTIKDESFGYNKDFSAARETGFKGSLFRLQPIFDGKLFRVIKKIPGYPDNIIERCNPIINVFPDGSQSCYTSNDFVAGITVKDVRQGTSVSVELVAQLINSRINPAVCANEIARGNTGFCGEQFHNIASAVDSEGRNYSDFADLFTPCPYLLTRGLGDIILEQGFTYGSDITACFSLPNIEGEIIEPLFPIEEEEIVKGGKEAPSPAPLIPSNLLCKNSNKDGGAVSQYSNPIKNLSSGLCELQQSISQSLTSDAIRQAISDNIVRFTRENANLNIATIRGEDINEVNTVTLSNQNYKVYKTNNALEVKNVSPVKEGSRTFIIQGKDLTISSNIVFDEQVVRNASFKETPSIAFIVIGGDIKIAPNVTHLDGVYVSIKDPKKPNGPGGQITGTGAADLGVSSLEFNGAIVGDIEPLFKSRTFAGDAKKNQGTIVINYGAWLYYNLPPVLRDLVNLQQEQMAR